MVYKYLYALKDLRNAVAHNDVVFDTRFKRIEPTKAMKRCLEQEVGLPYVNFKTIGDYVILVCYYLKLLGVRKNEISAFIRQCKPPCSRGGYYIVIGACVCGHMLEGVGKLAPFRFFGV